MKKVLMILIVLSIFIITACGEKKVVFKDPDLTDKDQTTNDDDTDDTPLTDNDTDDSSPVTDNDTDDSSPVTDNDEYPDETPDEIGIDCEPDGDKKCDAAKTSILECIDGVWETNEICENNETCDDTREAILCAPHICVPATTYCKTGNVYTCATDGLSEEMTTECTATQYCDDTSDPATCKDQVCTPDELYCDGNVLKECNGIGSGGTVEKDCGANGECDIDREDCVFTGELGKVGSTSRENQRRGNFFNCTENVTVIEFSQGFNLSEPTQLTWAIYEDANDDGTYQRIFEKTSTVSGDGEKYYSTGNISVSLKSGRKYLFFTAWVGTRSFLDGASVLTHPVDVGFGSSFAGHSSSSNLAPEELVGPFENIYVYNQEIKYVVLQ